MGFPPPAPPQGTWIEALNVMVGPMGIFRTLRDSWRAHLPLLMSQFTVKAHKGQVVSPWDSDLSSELTMGPLIPPFKQQP